MTIWQRSHEPAAPHEASAVRENKDATIGKDVRRLISWQSTLTLSTAAVVVVGGEDSCQGVGDAICDLQEGGNAEVSRQRSLAKPKKAKTSRQSRQIKIVLISTTKCAFHFRWNAHFLLRTICCRMLVSIGW
jgi:hypothetical protein